MTIYVQLTPHTDQDKRRRPGGEHEHGARSRPLFSSTLFCILPSRSSPPYLTAICQQMVWTSFLLLFVAAWAIPSLHHANPTASPREVPIIAGAMPTPSTHEHELSARPQLSKRVLDTEPAHIDAVLSRYADMSPRPANLAQGVAHWDPPPSALYQMKKGSKRGGGLAESSNHKYGPALGLTSLREALIRKLERENGLDMAGQEVPCFALTTAKMTQH